MNYFHSLPLSDVRIDDPFWNERLRLNREISIRRQYDQCRETGRIEAFRLQWKEGVPKPHIFWDSDVAKWVEAASYSLITNPDPELHTLLDETVRLIVSAQQPDGYLNTYYTQFEKDKRWSNLRDNHELYCAGHLIEAGVAHFTATGDPILLDAVRCYADYIDTVFGRGEGKKRGYCGHEEIELALVRLYHATGEKRHLELARYFVEERGVAPSYFQQEALLRGNDIHPHFSHGYEHFQAHLPVREQKTPVGHAVRALYLYCAMADLAREIDDPTLLQACVTLWENLTTRRMYITGGVGNSRNNEGFTKDYDLTAETAYCETCASIALVLWSRRLLLLDCDGRYADIMERALYNGVISGVSVDGTRFFYENPLASRGDHHRQEWFGCACCPSNLSRLLASLGQYLFTRGNDGIAIHLYIQSGTAWLPLGDTQVKISMQTAYPNDGDVKITIDTGKEITFSLRLRIPAWCGSHTLLCNGKPVTATVEKGYAIIRRTWISGDTVQISMKMPVELMEADPALLTTRGQVALQRGPVVYCVEDADCGCGALNLVLPPAPVFHAKWEPGLLNGITVIEGRAFTKNTVRDIPTPLYHKVDDTGLDEVTFRAIPYHAWDNREAGAMTVWIPRLRSAK